MSAPDDTPVLDGNDLGVLLIHGIGSQSSGATLTSWANAICEELSRSMSVEVVNCILKTRDDASPPHLTLTLRDEGEERTITIAEASWAEVFSPPSNGQLLLWSVRAVPWTVVLHWDERFRRAGNRLLDGTDGSRLWAFIDVVFETVWLFLGLLLAPLAILAIALLFIASIIPYAPIRSATSAALRALTGTLGDSLVFTENVVIKAAIRTRVVNDMQWLRNRAQRLVVLAHSQGAAVAHSALRSEPAIEVDHLITFGSGLRKLLELEKIRSEMNNHWATLFAWGCALSTAVAAAAIVQAGWDVFRGATGPSGVPRDGAFLVKSALVFPFVLAGLGLLIRTVLDTAFGRAFVRLQDAATRGGWNPFIVHCTLNVLGVVLIAVAAGLLVVKGPVEAFSLHSAVVSIFLGIGFTSMIAWRYSTRRGSTAAQRRELEEEQWRSSFQLDGVAAWDDVYARLDPVSNGPLVEYLEPPGLQTRWVSNAESVLLDHTTYWKNRTQFVRPLSKVLAAHAFGSTRRFPSFDELCAFESTLFQFLILGIGFATPLGALWFGYSPAYALGISERAEVESVLTQLLQGNFSAVNTDFSFWLAGYGGAALLAYLGVFCVCRLRRWRLHSKQDA